MKLLTGFGLTLILLVAVCWFADDVWGDVQQFKSPAELIESEVQLEEIVLTESTSLLTRDGTKFATLHGAEHRVYIPYDELPISVVHAFIAAEDHHFFEHSGIDGAAIIRAMIVNARSDSIEQGGSTITQQLAKNLFLSQTKTYKRKLNEAFFSYQLEKQLSKEKILELYSNAIYFGNGVYGIETASRFYFGKTIKELSLAEIALLCGIPNRPTSYDPTVHLDAAIERQHYVLKKMRDNQFITKDEYIQAIEEKINIQVSTPEYQYPDYTSYVLHELKELVRNSEPFIHKWKKAGTLEEKQEINENIEAYVYELIYEKGVIIETNLNTEIQRKASVELKQLPSGVEGAFVVLDHTTHQVAAIIGGKNLEANEFNRAFQAYRQPGSAMKPLLAYAPFLDVTSATLKVPIDASPYCKHGYCPQNYGHAVYSNVSIREAIGKSINTAAVRITDQIGVERAFQYLKPFHFEKVIQKDHTVASVLGGLTYGVTPLELTNAYTTFSNGGTYKSSRAIKRVLSTDGRVLYEWEEKSQRVWKKETNDKMRTLLNYVVTNGTARRANLPAPYIGGKTGTTNDIKDLWFIGMTDRFTAGIWVGKDKPAPIRRVQRNSQHLRIWKEIMRTTLR